MNMASEKNFLRVSGTSIVDRDERPVILKGVSRMQSDIPRTLADLISVPLAVT